MPTCQASKDMIIYQLMNESNKALLAEEANIQRALLGFGYFAHDIQFKTIQGGVAPSLTIKARPACKGDEELIGLSQAQRERKTLSNWYEKKGYGKLPC
jgi:hypothetical protein